MKKLVKPVFIGLISILFGIGFYNGIEQARGIFLDEFVAFVVDSVGEIAGATGTQYSPMVAQVSGAIVDAGGAVKVTAQEVKENVEVKIDSIFEGDQVVEEVGSSFVIRDDRSKKNLPSRIKDTLTFQTVSVPDVGRALVADLDSMMVHLYEDSILLDEFPLKSKGKPGSPWETPSGEYQIEYKNPNHFSSIGEVNMPFSMQFFGNFFIHGWPEYPDGTPVAEGYSGGCIRVEDPYIEEIYDFVDVGTTIFIVGGEPARKLGEYIDKGIGLSRITSESFLVADLDTGEVILEREANRKYPIASLTKLMTALVSLEAVNQFVTTTVSPFAVSTYGYQGNFEAGEKIEVRDLLFPLLLASSNDAAEAIAEVIGRNYFMNLMNKRAQTIGLSHTSFDDPSGLSQYNISTAEDLFRLTQYIYKSKRYIFDVTRMQNHDQENHTWYSNSRFIRDDRYRGSKNGYTDEALKTLILHYEVTIDGSERNIGIVLLQGTDSVKDVKTILQYLQKNVTFLDVEVIK